MITISIMLSSSSSSSIQVYSRTRLMGTGYTFFLSFNLPETDSNNNIGCWQRTMIQYHNLKSHTRVLCNLAIWFYVCMMTILCGRFFLHFLTNSKVYCHASLYASVREAERQEPSQASRATRQREGKRWHKKPFTYALCFVVSAFDRLV